LSSTCAALALFASVDGAALTAVKEALAHHRSAEQEYAGAIFRCDDQYGYTTPRTSGRHDRVRVQITLPKGSKLAAIYHTHPGAAHEARFFSEGDTESAAQLRVPSYLGVVRTGDIRLLVPGTFRPGFVTLGQTIHLGEDTPQGGPARMTWKVDR